MLKRAISMLAATVSFFAALAFAAGVILLTLAMEPSHAAGCQKYQTRIASI